MTTGDGEIVLGSQTVIRGRPTPCRHCAELTKFTDVRRGGLSDAITRTHAPSLEGLYFSSVASTLALQGELQSSQSIRFFLKRTDTGALCVNNDGR